MKAKKSILLFIIASFLFLSGCNKATDYGWIRFVCPSGYVKVDQKSSYVTISQSGSADAAHKKVDGKTIRIAMQHREPGTRLADAETFVSRLSETAPDSYLDAGTRKIGKWNYYIADHPSDGGTCLIGYANVNEDWCVSFRTWYINIDDKDLRTVLSTLVIDTAELP